MGAALFIIALMILDMGYELAKHGQDRDSKHNFFITFITYCIYMTLYYYAGLFDKFN